MTMERANLLNMAKLSIKGLIESALSFGRTLDSDYPPLQQFFVVMEHCLKHGLRGNAQRAAALNDVAVSAFCNPFLETAEAGVYLTLLLFLYSLLSEEVLPGL